MGSRKPSFSICIPTYNHAPVLRNAVQSALTQNFGDFELIVVDNASTDATQEVLAQFKDPRMQVFRNPKTVNMYANHNICLNHARGVWCVYLHSDDELLPDALSIMSSYVFRDPDVKVIFPAQAIHRPYLRQGAICLSGRNGIQYLLRWPWGSPSGTAYSYVELQRLRFGDQHLAEDFSLLIRTLAAGGTIIIIPEKTVMLYTGVRQYSFDWERSSQLYIDVARSVNLALDKISVQELAEAMRVWRKQEIARLLQFLAYAQQRDIVRQIERRLYPRIDFKLTGQYLRALCINVLGFQTGRLMNRVWLGLRDLWRALT